MNFKLKHHNKILTILESLDREVLKKGSAYFGGGTLLALDFGEYRWRKDVDFISSVASSGYKNLRIIDLAVFRLQSSIPQKAVEKAGKAYKVLVLSIREFLTFY